MRKLKEENIELLGRKRVMYELEHNKQATPKKEVVVKEIAKDLKVDENLIKIRHIYPHFGVEKAKVIAHVYKTKEAFKKFEERKKKKKKEKKKEAPAEKPKEEKKVEGKPKENGEKKEEKQETK